jgi:uncharacterized protein YdhG (YjbR/CyaY superfamily)
MISSKKPLTVDDYIQSFPPEVKKMLQQLRATIRKTAPKAIEKISYGMPAYMLNGRLVYFAGYKKHIGFYPMPGPIKKFKKEISAYKSSKGAVQFPLDRPLPVKLISQMIKFRMMENELRKKNS